MAEAATRQLANIDSSSGFLPGMSSLNLFKQLGLMIGIAASVALGVFLVLWGSEPDMRPLGMMDSGTSMEVVSYLEQSKTRYNIDNSGMIFVDQNKYQRVKMELAGQGLSLGDSSDQFLNKESGFGVSQRLESARLLRSKELQLAKTIGEFSGVRAAKVHLAIPKETAFLKHKREPSASVLLNLYGNRQLEDEQVRAIVDLVTGSVANLERSKVTVTDQFGRLLHSGSQSVQELETSRELKITRERQAELQQRVAQILTAIVGDGNYTVQVNVEMDFTKTEQTQQMFNPELPSLRSERTLEDEMQSGKPQGVPGALSNQPPVASTIPENLAGSAANSLEQNGPKNRRIEAERNYDLDTTISHTRQQVGVIQRVSVSVGLDFINDPQNATNKIARSSEQVSNINRLIRGAVGYNARRGDLVEIESFKFVRPDSLPDPAPLEFYEQPLFSALWKPVTALLLGLILIFAVLKPLMRKLSTPAPVSASSKHDFDDKLDVSDLEKDSLSLGQDSALGLPGPNLGGSVKSEQAKTVAAQDPTMVAQLVKNWVEQDE